MSLQPEAWIGLATLLCSIFGGFAAWMYRVDRNLTLMNAHLRSLNRAIQTNARQHDRIWQRLADLDEREDNAEQRLTKVETRIESLVG